MASFTDATASHVRPGTIVLPSVPCEGDGARERRRVKFKPLLPANSRPYAKPSAIPKGNTPTIRISTVACERSEGGVCPRVVEFERLPATSVPETERARGGSSIPSRVDAREVDRSPAKRSRGSSGSVEGVTVDGRETRSEKGKKKGLREHTSVRGSGCEVNK